MTRPPPGEVWIVDLDDGRVRVEVLAETYTPNPKWVIFRILEGSRAGQRVALPPPGSVERGAKQWRRKAERPAPPPPASPRKARPAGGRIRTKKPSPQRGASPRGGPRIVETKVTHMLPGPPPPRAHRKGRPPDPAEELRRQGIPVTRVPTPEEQAQFAREFPEHVRPMEPLIGPPPPLPPAPPSPVRVPQSGPVPFEGLDVGQRWLVSEQGVTWPGQIVEIDPDPGPYGGVVKMRVVRSEFSEPEGEPLTVLAAQLVERLPAGPARW